jgi:predicted thioredoxin/glutaredoxin
MRGVKPRDLCSRIWSLWDIFEEHGRGRSHWLLMKSVVGRQGLTTADRLRRVAEARHPPIS